MSRAQERMRPGELALRGFLGADTRNRVDIPARDDEGAQAAPTIEIIK